MIDVIEECTIMLQTPNNPSLCLPLATCLPFYDIFYMASYKHPALWEKRNQISIIQRTIYIKVKVIKPIWVNQISFEDGRLF